ncbi:MAG: FeoA family protein [Candidatus Methanomethylicaceae archaeon]
MLEEIIEIFCKLKAKLGKVTKKDMIKEGLKEEDLDLAIKEGLLIEKNDRLELTNKGEERLLNHRETFLHDSIIHKSKDMINRDFITHWRYRHGITCIEEFYDRLKAIPYHIEELELLIELPEGAEGEVVLIVGGRGVIMRLCSLGITPGTKIKILRKAPIGGPLEIEVRGTRVAIGRGIASKILVKPL